MVFQISFPTKLTEQEKMLKDGKYPKLKKKVCLLVFESFIPFLGAFFHNFEYISIFRIYQKCVHDTEKDLFSIVYIILMVFFLNIEKNA